MLLSVSGFHCNKKVSEGKRISLLFSKLFGEELEG